MNNGKEMEIVNRKSQDELKHDYLRTRALLYLALEKLGGEMLVSREEYIAIKKTCVPIGLSEMLNSPDCMFLDLPRISFNMGEPIWVAAIKPEDDA